MPKTGLKTFVYSFCTSLFMISVVNGVVWHARSSKNQDIKLPNKNVMLFIQGMQTNPSVRSAPVKKIVLTKLEDIKTPENPPQIPLIQSPSQADEPDDNTIILADNDILPLIPLEESFEVQEKPAAPAIVYAASDADLPPQIPLKQQRASEYVPKAAKDIQQKMAKNSSEQINLPKKAPQILPDKIKPAAEVKIAQASEPKPLLPLQKGYNELNRDNYKVNSRDADNQVALADKNIPISGMIKVHDTEDKASAQGNKPQWQTMAEKKPQSDSPWVVAHSAGAKRNSLLENEEYYKDEELLVKQALNQDEGRNNDGELLLASETVKNLLIPIPEDILNDDNLTPQLVSSKNPEEQEKEKAVEEQIRQEISLKESQKATKDKKGSAVDKQIAMATQPTQTAVPSKESGKNSLLSSLGSIFQSESQIKQQNPANDEGIIEGIKKKIRQRKGRGKIMPTEMRLSFQPNRAEISGQTLRWIQAFAARAANNPEIGIEIRIDGTSAMELQQKRLNLLHNILTNRGVEYSKINTIFTNREPNSFILRTTTLNFNNNAGNINRNNNRMATTYVQW